MPDHLPPPSSAPPVFTPSSTPPPRQNPSSGPPPKKKTKKPLCDPFEDDLDQHPDAHFLSPVQMYEYEDWASDSDDDGDAEEVAWDAGITDFALFDSDRRHAAARQEVLPNHWDHLLNSQALALQRAVERNRGTSASSDSHPTDAGSKPWTPLLEEDCPQLTPDTSPHLRDQLDMDAPSLSQPGPHPHHAVPDYLSSRLLTSSASDGSLSSCSSFSDEELDDSDFDDDDDDDDDYETPISVLLARARERQRQARRLDRPGLRSGRTMSGKVHVWRRPSRHIYPVGEDVEAERMAEMA